MRISMIAFTTSGCMLSRRLGDVLSEHEVSLFAKSSSDEAGLDHVHGTLSSWTADAFSGSDAIVFVGSVGIAVRSIAPFVERKDRDPAVICIDEKGRFVIPILSGHIGGGNDLARTIAERTDATAVITTATDINGRFSVDSFAKSSGMHIDSLEIAKEVSSRILDGRFVGLSSEYEVHEDIPEGLTVSGSGEVGIRISDGTGDSPFDRTLHLTPRNHVIGIGCRRGASAGAIGTLVSEMLHSNGITADSIRSVASIDLKRDEPGLLEFCGSMGIEPVFFSSEELNSLDSGFTGSEFVRSVTGTDNVCERAALFASHDGEVIQRKVTGDGVTAALVKEGFEVRFRKG